MLDPKLKEKISQAYVRLGEIGYQTALNLRKGKDHTPKQTELWLKGRQLRFFIKVLTHFVDLETTPPTLYRITEKQVNTILLVLDKLGNLDTVPIVPTIQMNQKPVIVKGGLNGTPGTPGDDGEDANIIVEPAPGETQLTVEEIIDVDGVKRYRLSFIQYEAPALNITTSGGSTFQKGVVLTDKVVFFGTTKGSQDITALTATDTDLNILLQAVVSLPNLNDVIQPVSTFITIPEIDSNLTIAGSITDGVNSDPDTLNITFYYPLLYGASDTLLSTTHYTALTKRIQGKSNTTIPFNDTNKYFYIMFPDSYGTLSSIKDQNGFEVIGAFTTGTVSVTSSGLDVDWTLTYRYYRTTTKTDINGTYSIAF